MRSFKCGAVLAVLISLSSLCSSRTLQESDEESVVSIYTTIPTTTKTGKPLDVYQQIATNIADRVTSPIYKFLGINKTEPENRTSTTTTTTPKHAWEKVSLSVTSEDPNINEIDNDISKTRDVEELTSDATTKAEKPEKITLYPIVKPAKFALNDTMNEVDSDKDSWEIDDVDSTVAPDKDEKPVESGIIWFLEMVGSIFQLLWGGISAWFTKGSRNTTASGDEVW